MPPDKLVAVPGRLDAVLAEMTGSSRADVQRAIAAGLVEVDGLRRPKSYRLEGGESLTFEPADESALQPEGPPVPVLFEDQYLMVISKPAGLSTHPTRTRRTGTLVNRLIGMGEPLSSGGGPLRLGIVHRLDIGTSGLMLVAKTDQAHELLSGMMKRHEVQRTYLALVRGAVANDTFSVEAPLGRRADRIVVDRAEGREAQTALSVLERLRGATLLQALPRTGRTHQIRVHLSAVGHPILGDRAYGGMGDLARALGLTRPFLHSSKIAFEHPISRTPIEIEDPLPEDLASALEIARGDLRP